MNKVIYIARWIVGSFLAVMAIAGFSMQEYAGAIFFLVVALFTLPVLPFMKKSASQQPQVMPFVSPAAPETSPASTPAATNTNTPVAVPNNTVQKEPVAEVIAKSEKKPVVEDQQDDEWEEEAPAQSSYGAAQSGLSDQYKHKLNLNPQEVAWLSKFWAPTNIFLANEGCIIATIKLYLESLKAIDKTLVQEGSSLVQEVEYFKAELKKPRMTAGWSDYDKLHASEKIEAELFFTLFRRAERVVRQAFRHKRRISAEYPAVNERLRNEFETRLGDVAEKVMYKLAKQLKVPDEATEIQLNSINVNRWKAAFEQLAVNLTDKNREQFVKAVFELARLNKRNSTVENIYFEASKMIARDDKAQGLKFYIHYLYYDLKSDRFDDRQLTKSIQKSLFRTNEQLHDFEKIVAELMKTKDLDKALASVDEVYQPKRKKIELDNRQITEVQQQDRQAVGILNGYLQDSFENDTASIKSTEINSEEISINIIAKLPAGIPQTFARGINLNQVQQEIIAMFRSHSLILPMATIEGYCTSRGIFKNQVIDSINEVCYEVLDDNLIEEEGHSYTIQQGYYQKITAAC